MRERRREEAPRLGVAEVGREGHLVGEPRVGHLAEEDGDADADDDHDDERPLADPGHVATEDRPALPHRLLALAHAVDALHADRGGALALGAHRPAAALAAHVGDPVGVTRTDRHLVGGAGLSVCRGLTHAASLSRRPERFLNPGRTP